mmetsp:Transcript_71524/g.202903  ORF Transcript_71524/g.202903 Transcript_71524/m.202903 type:complete len:227 (-) Transcript_71524:1787-2467(-)
MLGAWHVLHPFGRLESPGQWVWHTAPCGCCLAPSAPSATAPATGSPRGRPACIASTALRGSPGTIWATGCVLLGLLGFLRPLCGNLFLDARCVKPLRVIQSTSRTRRALSLSVSILVRRLLDPLKRRILCRAARHALAGIAGLAPLPLRNLLRRCHLPSCLHLRLDLLRGHHRGHGWRLQLRAGSRRGCGRHGSWLRARRAAHAPAPLLRRPVPLLRAIAPGRGVP